MPLTTAACAGGEVSAVPRWCPGKWCRSADPRRGPKLISWPQWATRGLDRRSRRRGLQGSCSRATARWSSVTSARESNDGMAVRQSTRLSRHVTRAPGPAEGLSPRSRAAGSEARRGVRAARLGDMNDRRPDPGVGRHEQASSAPQWHFRPQPPDRRSCRHLMQAGPRPRALMAGWRRALLRDADRRRPASRPRTARECQHTVPARKRPPAILP